MAETASAEQQSGTSPAAVLLAASSTTAAAEVPEQAAADTVLPAPDELAAHTWSKHLEDLTRTSFWAVARRLPAIIREALSIAASASRRDTVAAVGLNLVAGVSTTLGLLATGSVLRELFTEGPTPERVMAALPALVVAAVAVMTRGGLTIAAGWAQARLMPAINMRSELRMYDWVTKVRQEAFDQHAFAQDMMRARDRGTREAASIVDGTVDLITGVVGVAATAAAVGFLEPLLLPCLLAVALPSAVTAIRMARRDYLFRLATIDRNRRMWMLEVVMANRYTSAEIRHFQMRSYLLGEYERLIGEETEAQLRLAKLQTRTRLIGASVGGIAMFGLYLLLGWMLLEGAIPLAAAGVAVLALQMARSSLGTTVFATNSLYESALYYQDYADFIAACQKQSPPEGGHPVAGFGQITVEDVSMSYPDSESLALDGVSFTLRLGTVVALVGENGSGKSTLAKLLSGLYRPTAGRICWDGTDTRDLDHVQLMRQVSVVSQDWWRFPFSARSNVTLGRDQHAHNEEEMEAAARKAAADDVVKSLAYGWDTLLSKEFKAGTDLSSGQWQRLVAARGFYRDASLLICDEPSAALDARAEHTMFQQLVKHPDRTVVLISHRLSNVKDADHIIVMDKGKIIQEGDHHTLMGQGGLYRELWSMQADRYLTESPPQTATPAGAA